MSDQLKSFMDNSPTNQLADNQLGPTKHRTDRTDRTDHTDRTGREIAAGKAQINYRDLVINLYTAYHAMHDEFSQKFYRTKFADDRQTLCHKKRRNTAWLSTEKQYIIHFTF